MSPSTVYAKSNDFVQRQVAGECILVPVRRNLTEANSIYVLNETGAAFWSHIDGTQSMMAIEQELAHEYDVGSEQLHQDVETLLTDLLSIRAIHEVSVHDGSAT